jgi:hypothetical protein
MNSSGHPPSLPGNAARDLLFWLAERNRAMREDLEQLKQRIPLLDYLRRRNWTARRGSDSLG